MGLGFVFFAMVELACVLILKQKEEWFNAIDGIASNDSKSDEIVFKYRVPYHIDEGTAYKENESKMYKTKNQRGLNFRTRMWRMFYSLPLTSKIDVVSFILFYLIFFLVNLIYWPKALSRG